MIEKQFEGNPWDVVTDVRRYLSESMGIEKEYKVVVRIEEL